VNRLPSNASLSLASLLNQPLTSRVVGLSGLLPRAALGISAPPTLLGSSAATGLVSGFASNRVAIGQPQWIHVVDRFSRFLDNLELTAAQVQDGATKYKGVVSCLNAAYYSHNSDTANAFLIGSWAKRTRIRPPRDVDLYFILPPEVYHRFDSYPNGVNKQSALLQEVKGKLLAKYWSSSIKGDGPVVLASFESYNVEIVPAFALSEAGSYWVYDTKNGGKYVTTKPLHEVDAICEADARNNQNVRRLIRMLKAWQAWCTVPIKSFYLELLAIEFLDQWHWRQQSYFFYDWMCRDFFAWMINKANSFVLAPGTYEILWLGENWKSRADGAYARAVKACDFERANEMLDSGDEWQKIFGTDIPRYV
jgi:Second Messenger Oligonucleotide or Dinucleotide Synthetase domain